MIALRSVALQALSLISVLASSVVGQEPPESILDRLGGRWTFEVRSTKGLVTERGTSEFTRVSPQVLTIIHESSMDRISSARLSFDGALGEFKYEIPVDAGVCSVRGRQVSPTVIHFARDGSCSNLVTGVTLDFDSVGGFTFTADGGQWVSKYERLP